MSQKKNSSKSFDRDARRALRSIFLILFIDLVGFSIIFPLFPAMLTHYLAQEGQTGLLGSFLRAVQHLQSLLGSSASLSQQVPIVLFGGVLGSLYSLLQFLFAPVWGALSDRYGRKPILILSLSGIALSYVGWFFAGSFWLLVLARVVGGGMSGNISAATAAVSDVTGEKNRSSGMAIVGIAFGLGFLLGPAIGGLLALSNPLKIFPDWARWGVHPFSWPAAFAGLLTFVNLFWVCLGFRETLPSERKGRSAEARTLNPLAVLGLRHQAGIFLTIVSYFVFLSIFSGMEFSLTFLTFERFGFTPARNGIMFVFIGLVLALTQGGYVRRKAHAVGEKTMTLRGLICIAPGLALVGLSHSVWVFYAGLFFLAVGSAMVTPCLTSLVSLYAPATQQGRVLGIFRSMGALARVIGPLAACILYWRLHATAAYLIGASLLLLPFYLGLKLPAVPSNAT